MRTMPQVSTGPSCTASEIRCSAVFGSGHWLGALLPRVRFKPCGCRARGGARTPNSHWARPAPLRGQLGSPLPASAAPIPPKNRERKGEKRNSAVCTVSSRQLKCTVSSRQLKWGFGRCVRFRPKFMVHVRRPLIGRLIKSC